MDNLPSQSLSMTNGVSFVAPLCVSAQSSSTIDWTAYMERLVIELSNPNLRENAICVLSKRKELFHELAPLLWNSFGTIAVLLQEIISIYRNLSPPTLSPAQSIRVCNVLALLQCLASHPNTRMSLITACIPHYVYPFLEMINTLPQFHYLRVASLGVIGALVKDSSKEVILFLLSTEIIPLCLRSMEIGNELSKNVATFILQKILLDDDGLAYVCATTDRFLAVRRILDMVLESHERQPSTQLLKLIIPCYSRLSQNRRAGIALTSSLPGVFTNPAFINSLREDPTTWRWMEQLYENIRINNCK
ncbi:CCR4-NOT transcription complex subunit 9-like [Trifolium pratense]|uniref:CCR4-NOT transcription complex subunit 9-like n=1 Tax=Trifolium pratense TaxID=57577 RepID=UPI001E6912D3|nr:CCR4-NOT transcription complex subunit 9-like [Trifolium pratense]